MNKMVFRSNWVLIERTAGPSTALRSGRDDKFIATERLNCRGSTQASPDFLLNLVALANFMRFSLPENRIRGPVLLLRGRKSGVRSFRDDKGEGERFHLV